MLFCVSVDSPRATPITASGRWTVDAEDEHQAFSQVLALIPLRLWPRDSDWYVTVLCDDCPYRAASQDQWWPYRPIHCRGRRRTKSAWNNAMRYEVRPDTGEDVC